MQKKEQTENNHIFIHCNILMAKACDVCGKGTRAGNNRSHSMVATKRTFKPNIQKKKILLADGFSVEVKLCTKCYKTYRAAA